MPPNELDKDNIDIVIYHDNCADGFASAFIVWYYYRKIGKLEKANMINYLPSNYSNANELLFSALIDRCNNKNILICDFSYPYPELLKIMEVCSTFMIIDHHKTSRDALTKLEDKYKIFMMERSGAGITWDYFFPGEPLPLFIAHIEDRDLFRFTLQDTNKFVTYFYEQPFDFNSWEKYLDEERVYEAISKGSNWLEYQQAIIGHVLNKAYPVIQSINNELRIVVYSNTSELKSDIGHQLLEKFPFCDFSAIWHYEAEKNKTYYSLRSTDSRMDCSLIAQNFSGCGHRNASCIAFDACVPYLPYERVPDHGIIDLLLGPFDEDTIIIQSIPFRYTLFKVDEVKTQWVSTKDYLDLIKRYFSSSQLIVFEYATDISKIINNPDSVITRNYTILFNDLSLQNSMEVLMYRTIMSEQALLVIATEKDFKDIFIDLKGSLPNPEESEICDGDLETYGSETSDDEEITVF